ncbi:MAG: zinc-binding dehydrogenase [Gemmatales bacterium]|nr:zinc-binding dehydrogenase [Gemmatales bacterium]MDW7993621.1 zinc-binding dehydrogenase [Gemmatales bacterium]
MKAVIFEQHGGPEVLQVRDVPLPTLEEDEVLVEVRACALNHLDLWVRRGLPGVTPMPHIGGCEVTGIVAALGPKVTGLTVGQRVMIAPGLLPRQVSDWTTAGLDHLDPDYRIHGYQTQGGFAEFSKARACDVIPISEAWSFEEWAAVPLTFLTAWNMLLRRAHLQPGEDVLVLGASSGVGVAAIQIAKFAGARVIAVAGGPEKCRRAEQLGADYVVDYTQHDVAQEVRNITQGRGVDIVFEHIGQAMWQAALKSLARNGRIVTCGATTGPKVELDLRFFFTQQLVVTGAYMGSRHDLLTVLRLVERRQLRPVIDSVFPLEQTRQAQEHMEQRRMFGKIVIRVTK